MRFGISGASGKLGRITAEALMAAVTPEDIILTTRTPEALSYLASRGATVRFADFDQPDGLGAAFEGVDRLFMVSASNGTGQRENQHAGAIEAATRVGVQHIIFPSMPNVDDVTHPVGLAAREYLEAEKAVQQSGVDWTVLRDGPYAELHVVERFAPVLPEGRVFMNCGLGEVGFVSRADVAAAAVAVLLSDAGSHAGSIYNISGPELLTYPDAAGLVAAVTGREFEYVEVDDADFAGRLAASGVPDLMVDALTGMGKAIREGYFAVQTGDAQLLTGKAPSSLREILENNRGVFDENLS